MNTARSYRSVYAPMAILVDTLIYCGKALVAGIHFFVAQPLCHYVPAFSHHQREYFQRHTDRDPC